MKSLFAFEDSEILNFVLKNNKAKALLTTALITGSTIATTGIVPVTVVGIESQQVAEAKSIFNPPIVPCTWGGQGCLYLIERVPIQQQLWWQAPKYCQWKWGGHPVIGRSITVHRVAGIAFCATPINPRDVWAYNFKNVNS